MSALQPDCGQMVGIAPSPKSATRPDVRSPREELIVWERVGSRYRSVANKIIVHLQTAGQLMRTLSDRGSPAEVRARHISDGKKWLIAAGKK